VLLFLGLNPGRTVVLEIIQPGEFTHDKRKRSRNLPAMPHPAMI